MSFLAGLRKAATNTSVGVTAIGSSSLNIEKENSENTASSDALAGNGNAYDTEAGLSTRTKSTKRKKTSCGVSDSPSSWEHLSCEELAVKFSSAEKVVSERMKQVDSTNKELQQQIMTLQSDKKTLQAENHKLAVSDRQKDEALTQLQKNHHALNNEVSTLKVQLKQKDERVEKMVASLDQERAAAILKYKASPRFAKEFQILKAPVLLHGYTLGVDEAKAPDLDIGSLANCNLYQQGQGDETEKRFKELADGQDILAMYKLGPPAR